GSRAVRAGNDRSLPKGGRARPQWYLGPAGQAGAGTASVDGSWHRYQSQREEKEVLIKIESALSGRFGDTDPAFFWMRVSEQPKYSVEYPQRGISPVTV